MVGHSNVGRKRRYGKLCSAKTPSSYAVIWPSSRHSLLKVVVDQEAPVIVSFQPVVEVNLVQIGRDQFFPQFVSFRTEESNLESGKDRNQGLGVKTVAFPCQNEESCTLEKDPSPAD
jgi:hypothetical protein